MLKKTYIIMIIHNLEYHNASSFAFNTYSDYVDKLVKLKILKLEVKITQIKIHKTHTRIYKKELTCHVFRPVVPSLIKLVDSCNVMTVSFGLILIIYIYIYKHTCSCIYR